MKFISLLVTLVFLVLCQEKQSEVEPTTNGFWQQLGCEKILEIRNNDVKVYDYCEVECNPIDEMLLLDIGKVESLRTDSLTTRKNLKTYKYVRLQKLPKLCAQPK